MRVTILYDNTAWDKCLTPDWGFSCLVEARGRIILFDTGAKTTVLAANMKSLNINPMSVDAVFISHDHWDHTGGVSILPDHHPMRIFVPDSFNNPVILRQRRNQISRCRESAELYTDFFTTGELDNGEQSLAIRMDNDRFAVIAGCAHPGVRKILEAAAEFGRVSVLIGGLHGFDEFELLNDMEFICPTHCTRYIDEIASRCPQKFISGGAGKVIDL
jgi:7,8-dihydropterin-6-yl-methyl-4-(beta-D-ribofuranosyl)aminobenzene 5'-phosphate synthase